MSIEHYITATSLKDKILASSRHILALEGYNGLSMRKIAKTVDCKAASIYHHFENKDKIVHALIDEGYRLQVKAMHAATEGIENPLERLRVRAQTYVEFGLQHPEFYHIMYVFITDEMERYPKENYRRNSHNIKRSVEDLKAAQQQSMVSLTAEPFIIANASAAMLHGLVSLLISNRLHIKLDTEQLTKTVLDQVLHLYLG